MSKPIKTICIDIETIPGNTKPSVEDAKAPSNYKDPDKIRKYQEVNVDKEYRKQSLDSLVGKILCIGVKLDDNDTIVIYNESEEEMMKQFHQLLLDNGIGHHTIWVGKNIKEFDLPWLYHRFVKYRLDSHIIMPKSPYSDMIFDIQDRFTPMSRSLKWKLDDMLKFLGLGGKTEGIDGSKVYDYYLEGNIDYILKYCKDDVDSEYKVYELLK